MSEITRILTSIERGEPAAAEQLLPLVYDELRSMARAKMAHEVAGHTLQPTALVHEAFLRLVGDPAEERWQGRAHFFAAAAEAMRRILVDNARRKKRLRRGGDRQRVELDDLNLSISAPVEELLRIDEALSRLAAEDETAALLVKMRYFAGMTVDEAAKTLEISRATAYRHWTYARAWIRCELEAEASNSSSNEPPAEND